MAHSLESPTYFASQLGCKAHAGALAAAEPVPARGLHPRCCGLCKRSDFMWRWKPQSTLTSRGEADVQRIRLFGMLYKCAAISILFTMADGNPSLQY